MDKKALLPLGKVATTSIHKVRRRRNENGTCANGFKVVYEVWASLEDGKLRLTQIFDKKKKAKACIKCLNGCCEVSLPSWMNVDFNKHNHHDEDYKANESLLPLDKVVAVSIHEVRRRRRNENGTCANEFETVYEVWANFEDGKVRVAQSFDTEAKAETCARHLGYGYKVSLPPWMNVDFNKYDLCNKDDLPNETKIENRVNDFGNSGGRHH